MYHLLNIISELSPPSVEQSPKEAEDGSRVTLVCKIRRNPNVPIILEWYQNNQPVDRSFAVEGDYVVNTYEVTASKDNQNFECRMSYGPRVFTVPHKIILCKCGCLHSC